MIDQLLSKIIQFLGLGENEARVYEYLINNKNINISEIAKNTQLNRTQVYDTFEALADFGLIIKPPGRNKDIILVNPSTILVSLRQKQLQTESYLRQFQSILPDLEQTFSLSNKSIPIRMIQGRVQFEDLFLEMYENSSKELLFIGNADEFYSFLDENYIDYAIKKRAKKGVVHRVLTFQPGIALKKLAPYEKRDLRQVRFLPADFTSLGYINIFGDKVVNWNTQLARAVVIQDGVIAGFYKTIFETLWKLCE
jgi:sugar-specific transcriptional regulator TrmB